MKTTDRSTHYQICLEGILDERWLRWFEGLEIDASAGNQTIILGEFDQSALHGLFNRIFDLGITLISVQRPSPAQISRSSFSSGKNIETPSRGSMPARTIQKMGVPKPEPIKCHPEAEPKGLPRSARGDSSPLQGSERQKELIFVIEIRHSPKKGGFGII